MSRLFITGPMILVGLITLVSHLGFMGVHVLRSCDISARKIWGFVFAVLLRGIGWQHALATDKITDKCYMSNKGSESTYVFPLYLYPNPEELGISTERSLNFQPAFLTALSEALALSQTAPFNLPDGISPEEILAYIYAILYSPTYRERYYEFLKYDFPRIPMPADIDQFPHPRSVGAAPDGLASVERWIATRRDTDIASV